MSKWFDGSNHWFNDWKINYFSLKNKKKIKKNFVTLHCVSQILNCIKLTVRNVLLPNSLSNHVKLNGKIVLNSPAHSYLVQF